MHSTSTALNNFFCEWNNASLITEQLHSPSCPTQSYCLTQSCYTKWTETPQAKTFGWLAAFLVSNTYYLVHTWYLVPDPSMCLYSSILIPGLKVGLLKLLNVIFLKLNWSVVPSCFPEQWLSQESRKVLRKHVDPWKKAENLFSLVFVF